MQRLNDDARSVLARYRPLGWRTRLHTRIRWSVAPLAALVDEVPSSGRILDWGCGHGLMSLYLALTSAGRCVVGIDIDEAKLADARTAGADFDVEFGTFEDDREWGTFDAVVVVDVLYLLGEQEALRLLTRLVTSLEPRGVLVLKEMSDRPKWKALVNHLEERLALALGITRGGAVQVVDPTVIIGHLRGLGLTVRSHDLSRGYLHPHHLIVAHNEAVE